MPLISVNDIEMSYESHGQGTPLLMIGGLGLDVSEMGALIGPLAGRDTSRGRGIAATGTGPGREPSASCC
jgi:hypothetical protein